MKYTSKVSLTNKKKLPTKGGEAGKSKRLSRHEMAAKNGKTAGVGLASSRALLGAKGSGGSSKARFLKKRKISKATRKKIRNVALVALGIFLIGGVLGGLWFFSYLQRLNDELPSLSDPFGEKNLSSVVYDRTGETELARFIGDEARDPVDITQIPEYVKWSFLAAEDIDFYTHQGFDPAAILRCGGLFVVSGGAQRCGGSTITQQVVKITTGASEVALERKLKEMIMAIKIEQAYTKDEVLQLYLTVAPFGGNIYGITTAAEFYFDKDVSELTQAQAALLAAIVQNPAYLSPTKGYPDPATAQVRVKERQEYVLGQLRIHKNKINDQTRSNYDDPELDDVITDEALDAAIEEELTYQPPVLSDYKAGHFVDYVKSKLTTENYKYNEEPFSESELLTGGYHIYTTLDYTVQQVAEQTVKDAMTTFGTPYKASNAAMVLLQPKTGNVIAMVGSKDYFGKSEGCDANGENCLFDPQVNIITSLQSPGSSTKPFGFYEAYRQGLMFTGSFLPDIPIDLSGGFDIKNYNNAFNGVTPKSFASQQLSDSRNLPAIIVLEAIGLENFLNVMRTFGYTTYGNSDQYGHSVILGGADVRPIEHAQGYGVFANGGDLVEHEVVTKIVDRAGNVVYESAIHREKVADERAVFLLNQSILNSHSISWEEGRQVSAKSGTSEDSTDVWISAYSPDFVAIGWMGNNNNVNLDFNAFGVTIVQPWVKNFLRQIGETEYLKDRTPFKRPAGVSRGGGCGNTDPNKCIGAFQGLVTGWMIDEFNYPADNVRTKIRVCKNQGKRLARPIDEFFDNAKDAVAVTYSFPYAPHWEQFLNKFMAAQKDGMPNGGPTQYCTASYGGTGDGVWINTLNINNGQTVGNTINIQGTAFTLTVDATVTGVDVNFNGVLLTATPLAVDAQGNFTGTVNVPAGTDNGTYTLTLTARDSDNDTHVETRTVVLNSATTTNLTVNIPTPSTPATVGTIAYTPPGSVPISGMQFCFRLGSSGNFNCSSPVLGGPNNFTFTWTVPGSGNYEVYATATAGASGVVRSATTTVTVP